MRRSSGLLVLCLAWPAMAVAQTPVKNPSAVIFTVSPDHASLTAYKVDIVRADGTVAQTLTVAPEPPDAAGDQRVALNVQPVAFGLYTIVIRAVAGATVSANSTPSPVWERAPGPPTKPRVE